MPRVEEARHQRCPKGQGLLRMEGLPTELSQFTRFLKGFWRVFSESHHAFVELLGAFNESHPAFVELSTKVILLSETVKNYPVLRNCKKTMFLSRKFANTLCTKGLRVSVVQHESQPTPANFILSENINANTQTFVLKLPDMYITQNFSQLCALFWSEDDNNSRSQKFSWDLRFKNFQMWIKFYIW